MAEAPKGYRDIPEADQKKAQVFFDYARTADGTGNYEYAIDMMLQGLAVDPDARAAHQTLRALRAGRAVRAERSATCEHAAHRAVREVRDVTCLVRCASRF